MSGKATAESPHLPTPSRLCFVLWHQLIYASGACHRLQTPEEFAAAKNFTILCQRPDCAAPSVSKGGFIALNPELESTHRFAVLTYEVAPEQLNRGERREKSNKTIRQTEAEAVLFAAQIAPIRIFISGLQL